MALTDEGGGSGLVMPVAPMYGGGGNSGFGFGGDWAWIILLLVLCGGWNNGFGGGFGGGGDLYPWMNQSNQISDGFRDSMLNTSITSIGDKLVSGQMDAMQNSFAIQSQLSQCCCDNRMATQDLKYTIATEESATRAANSANTQAILDKLCQLELDAKNDEIAQLRQEVLYARGQASQVAQTGQIVDSIYSRLDSCPVGTTPVYGRTPIFQCNNNGCGCGM